MMKQIRTKGEDTDKNNTIRRERERERESVPVTVNPRFRRPTKQPFPFVWPERQLLPLVVRTMKLESTVRCTLLLAIVQTAFPNPVPAGGKGGKFFFDSFPKGITISRVTTDDNPPQTTTGYSIRFVPLITLLAGLFPNFLSKLGQFTGVNKYVNTRRFDVADPLPMNHHNLTTRPIDDEEFDEEDEEDDGESELIECDASHLGLWPDKSDSQRYYKCEVDPRTPASANCIKDYFQGKHLDKSDVVPLERIEVPGVKPCFLLSMMKCANGFKYSHKTRICVPDIVFGSQQS